MKCRGPRSGERKYSTDWNAYRYMISDLVRMLILIREPFCFRLVYKFPMAARFLSLVIFFASGEYRKSRSSL